MRRLGIRWLFPLTGRRVFSVWAWIVLLPFGVFATGGYELADDPNDVARGTAVAIAAQLALAAAFLVGNLVERRLRSDAAHVAWVTMVLIAVAAGRPLLIIALQDATGGQLFPDQSFALRFMTNLLTIGIPTILVFVLVQTVRRSRDVRRRLTRVAERTRRDTCADERRSARLAEQLRGLALAPVLAAVEGARVTPFDGEQQAEALRETAHDVVRPLSHRIGATPIPEPEPEPDDDAPVPLPPVLLPPLRVSPPPPWVAPLGLLSVTGTALVANYGVESIIIGIVAFALGTILGGAAALIPTRRMPMALGLLVIAASNVAIGTAMAAIMLLPAPIPIPPTYWFTTPAAFAAFALVASLIISTVDRLDEDERMDAGLVADAGRRATSALANLRDLPHRVGRVLHTDVQGRIVATTLRLRLGTLGAEAVDELLAGVRHDLEAALEPAAAHAGVASPELLLRTVDRWTGVVPVTTDLDPDAWSWLALAPARTELLHEAVSEGLANAVRHGEHAPVDVTVARTIEGVRLVVRSRGRIRRTDVDGIGLRSLVEQGAMVELVEPSPGEVALRVDLGEDLGAELVSADR